MGSIHLRSEDTTLLLKFLNRPFEFHILLACRARLTALNEARPYRLGQLPVASTAQNHRDLRQSIMNHITLEIFSTTYEYVRGTVQALVRCEGNKSRMSNRKTRFLLLNIYKEIGDGHKPDQQRGLFARRARQVGTRLINGTFPHPSYRKMNQKTEKTINLTPKYVPISSGAYYEVSI